jgi:hypothetical protein
MYSMTLINDYTTKVWIYFLEKKLDAFETFKEWKALAEK